MLGFHASVPETKYQVRHTAHTKQGLSEWNSDFQLGTSLRCSCIFSALATGPPAGPMTYFNP